VASNHGCLKSFKNICKVKIKPNEGNELVYKDFTSPYSTIPSVTLADFNGDGKTDIIAAVNSNGYTNYIHSFNALAKNNALEKVTDGFNNTSTISYKYLTEGSSIYTKNLTSSYPLNVVQAPIMVVSSVTTPDGIGGTSTATYKYENAKLHRAGVGFLGFTTFQQDNTIQDGRSITEFEILTPQYLTAVKKQTTKQISSNTILSELTNTNNVTVNGTRYWQKTQGYEDKNLLTGATKGVWRAFDANGNITDESYDIVGVEVGTTSMGNFNTFGQPGYVFSYKKRFETPNLDYTWSSKSYDAKGALNWETFDQYDYTIGWQNTSTTYYDYYHTVGLPKSTTLTSSGLPTKVTTINSYDSKWRFATKMTNPLGQSSTKTYDSRWGTVLTETLLAETGVTGLTTTNYYDVFGKIYQTTTPQGISITKQYIWNPYLYLPRRFDIITTMPGRPTTWDTYDIFGRKIVATTQNYGSPSTRWVDTYQITEYDNRGNVSKQSTPVNGDKFASEVEYTTFQYDALNRSTSSSNPTIGTTSYTYSYSTGKTTVTMTNPAGQVSSKVTDAAGKVVSTTDYGGTLNFEYDNKGNQTAIKLGSTVLTSMTYDYRGNQTSLIDKNAGTTLYRYNAYGELEWQKDVMNTEYNMTYDIMGRLVTRYSLVEGLTTNKYVTTGFGLNQIEKVTGINGINQEYVYDAWHRVSQAKETIDNTVYTKSFTYNMYNDIETTTYPSGLVIKNSYSEDGFLFKVAQNNGQILFDGTDGTMNGYGKWENYKLGNIATDIQYNHWAMPQNIKGGGGSIQNLLLDWNLQTGNVNYRYDVRKSKYESFNYDNQNRLRSATVGGLPEQSYVIDDIGNIKSKTGVGAYFYHPTKIHAVEDIKNPQGVTSIVPSMQQDIIYTKYHRVEKITEGVNELTFVYASDYERRKTVLKQNNVVVDARYFMGDYEIDIKNGVTRHIHYIGGGDGLCAIVVKEGSADFNFFFTYKDHLGSILTVTDKLGGIVAEQNFDAWGRKRNFATWDYAGVQSVPDWLYRGFTGHEHLAEFGLINMNARLYDPILGRMLSPDNLVGSGSQGFNRYSYANNNPLKFTDPSGNFPWLAVAAFLVLTDVGYDLQKAVSPIAVKLDIGLGTHSTRIGIDISVGIPQSLPISYRYEVGATYNFDRVGGYGAGWQVRNGGEWGISIAGFGIKYGGTRYRDYDSDGNLQADQVVHTATVGSPLYNVSYSNDTRGSFPWASSVPFIPSLRDGFPGFDSDRYRTASGRLRAGLFEFGFFLHTGEATGENRIDGVRQFTGGTINDSRRSNGIVYLGFAGFKVGWDSEKNRHNLQNRIAHDQLNGQAQFGRLYPWVLRLNRASRFVFQFGGF
jgi:RHS repeat-associated protein